MRRFIAVGVLGLLVVLQAHDVSATVKGFEVQLGLELDYDDNIYQYSDRDLKAFNPTQEKYRGLSSTDDWIVTPGVSLKYCTPLKYTTRLVLEVRPKFYMDNNIKDYQVLTARLSQEFPGKWEIGLQYQTVPSYYLKRLADPPNQSRAYADAEFSINNLRVSTRKEIGRWFSGTVSGTFGYKDYNAEFNERDITIVATKAQVSFRPWKSFRLSLEGGHEWGQSEGWDDPAYNSDTSYDQWAASVSASQKITSWLMFGGGYLFESKEFITELVHDRGHYQRTDDTLIVDVYLRFQVLKGLSMRAGFELEDCSSKKDRTELPFTSYTERRWMISSSYEF
jgi:hypothetical protein